MRVLVADVVSLIRSGLIALIRPELPECEFIEAADFSDVLLAVRSALPDLLVIDPSLPGCVEDTSLRALRDEFASLRILVLALSTDRMTVLNHVANGMNGFIPKTGPNSQALDAIRTVLSGAVYIPFVLTQDTKPAQPPQPEVVEPAPTAEAPSSEVTFTGRQNEVLRLLAEGLSTKDIARELQLGVGTVKVHLAAVYRILGAHSRMEAVIRAGALKY